MSGHSRRSIKKKQIPIRLCYLYLKTTAANEAATLWAVVIHILSITSPILMAMPLKYHFAYCIVKIFEIIKVNIHNYSKAVVHRCS